MWPHFVNLLCDSWRSVVEALSTSTLSIVLFSLVTPIVTFIVSLAIVSRKKQNRKFNERARESLQPAAIAFAVPLVFLAIVLTWEVVANVYKEHQKSIATEKELIAQNHKLSADVEWRKHNLSTSDPVFSNVTGILGAFAMFKYALNQEPCSVMITAPPESGRLAEVIAAVSNSVSGCFTSGPSSFGNPDLDEEAVAGVWDEGVMFHAERDDKAALRLSDELGNLIQVRRSYKMPKKGQYMEPPTGTTKRLHVIWLQFGKNAEFNTERFSKKKEGS
jgi:hypothetical protein